MQPTLKTKAYNHIRRQLLLGEFADGVFFSSTQLAKHIGMSRTPVRDAISRLESEGILESVDKQGIRTRRLTLDEFKSKFELRILLESGAAEMAAGRIDDSDLQILRQNLQEYLAILKQMRQISTLNPLNIKTYRDLENKVYITNLQFHFTIIQASHNVDLIKVVGDLHIVTGVLGARVHLPNTDSTRQHAHDFRFHWNIYRMLCLHDSKRVRPLMEQHLADAMEYHLMIRASQNPGLSEAQLHDALFPYGLIASQEDAEGQMAGPHI